MSLLDEGVVAIADAFRTGASLCPLVEECLDRAEADPHHAFLHVDRDGALVQAEALEAARAEGKTLGTLAGVPVAIKDNLCVRDLPATCASKVLEGWIAPYDAHVIERLREAGAILVGKTNLDEFAMGSSTEHSAYGPTTHPRDSSRSPGGSSGGSAVAVAGGAVPASLGSDTGGSVRQPAAFCGVVALKPTYGRVSRYGLVAFASSLDVVGPFGRSVRDAARILEAIAAPDPRDATCAARPVDEYEDACAQTIRGKVVGVPRVLLEGADEGVRASFEDALTRLKDAGATIVDVDLPHASVAVSVYYLVAPAEASSNLSRYDGVRFGARGSEASLAELYETTRAKFGDEVKRRIMLGTYALSAGYYDEYYGKATKVRSLIRGDYEAAFEQCDVVATPTAPTTAFPLGSRT
ncbi:MAG: Asp-tRNA(Asn)/Glu-tRNA(Gln) amidotransferase subunit GatA, partial [Myxococcota bacterium]